MKSVFSFTLGLLFTGLTFQYAVAQEIPKGIRNSIGEYLTKTVRKEVYISPISIDSVSVDDKTVKLYANANCSYFPFRENNVADIYSQIRKMLPKEYANRQIVIITDGRPIEELIPCALRTTQDKTEKTFTNKAGTPLVSRISVPYHPESGLMNRHIAMWQSHGYYYESKLTRWEWQRARLFETVEDIYTQSYVLPYLVPMLENAGAYVLLPRERDANTSEVIVDNDSSLSKRSQYFENNGEKSWSDGQTPGFAQKKEVYINNENPFVDGTFRQVESVRKGKESTAEWIPYIPKDGKYAVYVSYHTVENSASDALYTIYHEGIATSFRINQKMGGGTWIYLGHFNFKSGKNKNSRVVLTNKSSEAGRIITADAVKIGGGYGNIARRISENGTTENVKSSEEKTMVEKDKIQNVEYPCETSGYPRYTEAARYWLQWAGFPEEIYSPSKGMNDYTDDYKCRGEWVNYLAGGSEVNPEEKGLNIPVDMSFAFHSDAGSTMNDSVIGTLGIYFTNTDSGRYSNGASRYMARDLTDLVQSQIVNDIRALYEPNWTRRGMWDKSYYEARVPKVPAMLLELLSHENFADMRYGLDPRFRFTVSRAIYKGILRFLASQYRQDYVVQPLPVDHMAIKFKLKNEAELSWQPVNDSLEKTAVADQYVVYTKIDDGDFDNGRIVKKNNCIVRMEPGKIYSFKVTALNKGGESFPSETLSASRAVNEKGIVLIVNGFDRISAPADFVSDSLAGFYDELDHGVPDRIDYKYVGSMAEFRRKIPWTDDDAPGFGASRSNYETQVIAGNTFDYPYVHGKAIADAGFSFVSCSNEAVMDGIVNMNDYKCADLILGKQRQTKMGRGGVYPVEFKTFPVKLQTAITNFCNNKGNILVSGSFVASDLWDNDYPLQSDKDFAVNILKYSWRTGQAAVTGKVKSVASPAKEFTGNFEYYNELNPESYVVESPDALEPACDKACTVFRYSENNLSAGIAYSGDYKTCVLGFPFESLKTDSERQLMMKNVLAFFYDE